MSLVLGIHNGHHASCAIVKDGVLVAGIEQERVTRIKADGQEGLSNRLPLRECLEAARTSLDQVDAIVSSFQAASPGGTGLHRPLVEPDFALFDPLDARHLVISHHYAHALAALGSSGFLEAAILVCDLAGSTTREGTDFVYSFDRFQRELSSLTYQAPTRTECLSIYQATKTSLALKYREYCIPHNTPDVFVQNVAALYDNVARMIFGKENAHGELMALASLANDGDLTALKPTDIVELAPNYGVRFRNDWQHRIPHFERLLDYAPLAHAAQGALQLALMQHARRARAQSTSNKLVVAGGVFLNILANSEISASNLFSEYYVPSSPHDAGISVGCAYAGWRAVEQGTLLWKRKRAIDRIGLSYAISELDQETHELDDESFKVGPISPSIAATLLFEGKIVARFAGRSEFGPRALGGRSLLASPLISSSKERLNIIKGRQAWRPVAPIVQRERISEFFLGPSDSPYMNLVHWIREEHRHVLLALSHPDGSTRAQTLELEDDPSLYDLLTEFARLSQFPILVNTSLNGPGEPIVETPAQAIAFFRTHPNVDALWLEDRLISRTPRRQWVCARLAPDTIVSVVYPHQRKRIILLRREISLEVSPELFELVEWHTENSFAMNGPCRHNVPDSLKPQLAEAVELGLLVPIEIHEGTSYAETAP
jgi:carbamoyltransferase